MGEEDEQTMGGGDFGGKKLRVWRDTWRVTSFRWVVNHSLLLPQRHPESHSHALTHVGG